MVGEEEEREEGQAAERTIVRVGCVHVPGTKKSDVVYRNHVVTAFVASK